jgi:hypothetical protein
MNLTPQRRDKFAKGRCPPQPGPSPYRKPVRPRPAKEMIMRLLALAGAFGLALVANSQIATQAEANPFGTRYCAQYRGNAENCGFYSFNQCLAAISGVGGMCVVAPIQTEVRNYYTPRGTYRVIRDAID